jgi:hypothetical protein
MRRMLERRPPKDRPTLLGRNWKMSALPGSDEADPAQAYLKGPSTGRRARQGLEVRIVQRSREHGLATGGLGGDHLSPLRDQGHLQRGRELGHERYHHSRVRNDLHVLWGDDGRERRLLHVDERLIERLRVRLPDRARCRGPALGDILVSKGAKTHPEGASASDRNCRSFPTPVSSAPFRGLTRAGNFT